MSLPGGIIKAIRDHAAECYPSEACGLVVVIKGRRRYLPCRNIAPSGRDFAIHPEDYANAEDAGEVVMVVHSHPNTSPKPSPADLAGCERSGLPWLIINWPTGAMHEFGPSGYVQPLYGREFRHGVIDCYTFIRDYYRQILGVELPDFDRMDNWWLGGENLYLDNFTQAGFSEVADKDPSALKDHDVILMTVASRVPNHGAIYLGNGNIGHHQVNRLSSRDVYGGWYQQITTHYLRHNSLR